MNDLVLLVDDSEISRAVIRRRLEEAGFRVNEAADGAQGAVAALREVPAVVITDLEMPIMDGIQLARLIKTDPATREVPVVILTSHTEAASRFWGLQTGADAYVTKDDLEGSLINIVRNLTDGVAVVGEAGEDAPRGPLEVLARVARHLDAGLMEATLINQVLQVGMARGGVAEAADGLLRLFSLLTHADLLAICILDAQQLSGFLHRPNLKPLSVDLARLKNFAAREFAVDLEDLASVSFEGDVEGSGPELGFDNAVTITFTLRDARAFLVIWPERPDRFAGLPQELMEKTAPHASLVLDNVLLAAHLWELSTFDGLTGLFNHRAIRKRLQEEVERADRHDIALSVALCDVDRFKRVNDTYGHLIGDAVLRELAKRLAAGLRTSDLVGRWGGEEFLAILPHSDLESACAVSNRACDGFKSNEIRISGQRESSLVVTASFGVACNSEVPGRGTADSLLALADRRLYEAKSAGRSCVKP